MTKEESAKIAGEIVISRAHLGTRGAAQFITEDHSLAPADAKEIGDEIRSRLGGTDDGSKQYLVGSSPGKRLYFDNKIELSSGKIVDI